MSAGGDKSTSNEIVISGISGRFPKSRNVREFSENLYNKVNMVDDSESKWKNFHDEVPRNNGKISDCDKFDAEFFAMSSRLANCTDPQSRMLLEHSYEAILDAGVPPQSLIGSQTGVFIGCSYSDSKDQFMYKTPTKFGHGISGNANYYTANRISQTLGLTGPSMTVDTACSSSAYAIDVAFKYIKSGMCESALVGGAQLVTNLQSTTEYNRLRVLSEDGICRSFDKKASGFTRADTICVIYLQKKKNSKRIYASLLNVATNNDGFKQEGSAFPSRILQQQLFEECFRKVKMDPSVFSYIEAHSTGTFVGDAEEIAAIDGAYCKDRSEPLLVGTVKSNMGHAEASSAMSATAKIILALETRKIAPNINLDEVREDIPAFSEGRIRIVTEIEDLKSPFVSLNSFGLGGANAHLVFEGNPKSKVNRGIPNDDLSRLVCWSGRTESSVSNVFDDIVKRPLDAEHIALLQATQTITNSANTYRGYGIFAQDKSANIATQVLKDVAKSTSDKRIIVLVYGGIGAHWQNMKNDLMMIPAFANAINLCHETLLQKNMNLKEHLAKDKLDSEAYSYVGVIAIEIALTDVMKAINLQPNFLIGHSAGELAVAYADNCLTLEETILSAYALEESISEANIIRGAMAVIGLSREALVDKLPGDIDVSGHSAFDSTMISGPELSVKAFVNQLSTENVFAKDVECSNVPLHSRYMKGIEESLSSKLGGIIKNKNIRSSKWLSLTYPEDDWNLEVAQTSCVEYHIKNLLNPIHEVSEKLPPNSILIEMSPNSILNTLKRRTLDDSLHFNLVEKDSKSGCLHLMTALGKIFSCGVDFDASKLSPPIEFPVSRNTPMIAPIIQWDHSQGMSKIEFNRCGEWFDKRSVLINISDKESSYLKGHVIDGKILLPGTAILVFVWESLSLMNNTKKDDFPVIFEEVKFLRATTLKENQDVILHISVHSGEGSFEVSEGQTLVATGIVKQCESGQLANIAHMENDDGIKLEEKEFYKEMRLRGYHHKDSFRAITEATDDGLAGKIKWSSNWTTFIDCLLQIQVLMKDTRQLVLPTKVRKLIIDPIAQRKALSRSYGGIVDVITCPYSKVIQAGGVELHEFEGTEVNRRSNPVFPVLESFKFVAHDGSFEASKIDAAKIFVQLLLENAPSSKFTSIEVDSNDGKTCFNELIHLALEDLPTITSDLKLLTTKEHPSEHVRTEVGALSEFNDVNFIIKSECLTDETFLLLAKKALKPEGFILSREVPSAEILCGNNLQILANIPTEDEVFVLFKFVDDFKAPEEVVQITPRIFDWLEPLQDALKSGSVLAYSQNDEISGIIGLVNCIRRESPNLKCVFIDDSEAPPFDLDNPFYKSQLSLGLPVNVYKKGHWGTYRHLSLATTATEKPRSNHVFANCMVKGDMSSIKWFEGSLNAGDLYKDPECIRVMYSAINFRDVMQASGKIAFEFLTRIQNECVLGFEFSGVTNSGRRLVGLAVGQTFSSHFDTRDSILWNVPESMSLAEAVTIPLVYCTVYLAFFEEVSIKAGESVLIHAGSGGVGIAALHVAFRYDLEVFTTVSTQEKKSFLLNLFPKLKPENIGNSRDTTFEEMIFRRTSGRGVDYVLNSLSEEKLLASIRCLADGGTFLEIGKFDIMSKTKIDMGVIGRNINMKTVFIKAASLDDFGVRNVQDRIQEDLMSGVIQPLHTNVFPASEIQQAFRFLASGKHIGKVLVQLRDKEDDMVSLPIAVSPKIFCDKECAYVIVGGLGGFGLELADWLILRGCKKLVLSSSRGVTNGYQAARIRLWESYGVKVAVDVSSVTTRSGCEKLLCRAKTLGNVGGIFNLAVALRDGLFENQTFEMFDDCFRPKAIATKNLDEISKILCPNLEHFVIFSSVSCGRGNAGQSNYGMANSIMERIIERRHRNNLPAKAIQFGAVGDVGLLADIHEKNTSMEIGGTLPQSIKSCMDSLDQLLRSEEPIVASMVVADKRNSSASQKGDIVELLCNVLGIRDKKSISMDSSLSKLGMDSLMTIEITQFLEREFSLAIPLKELQSMTLHDLQQLTKSNKASVEVKSDDSRQLIGMQILLMSISVESKSTEKILCLKNSSRSTQKTLIVPGIQGLSAPVWEQLSKRLEGNIYILQWNESHGARSIKAIHDFLIQHVIELFSDANAFNMVGYSFGSLLTLEIAKTLELRMMVGKVMMIDGSPLYLKMFGDSLSKSEVDDAALQNGILASLIRIHFPEEDFDKFSHILANSDWNVKMDNFILQAELEKKQLDKDNVKNFITEIFERCKMVLAVNVSSFPYLKTSQVSLVTASEKLVDEIDVAYGLKVFCSNPIQTKVVEGNHFSILNSEELYQHINQTLC